MISRCLTAILTSFNYFYNCSLKYTVNHNETINKLDFSVSCMVQFFFFLLMMATNLCFGEEKFWSYISRSLPWFVYSPFKEFLYCHHLIIMFSSALNLKDFETESGASKITIFYTTFSQATETSFFRFQTRQHSLNHSKQNISKHLAAYL